MKYLIMEDFSGQAIPFIFPDRVDHSDMREQLPYGQALSGGYVSFEDGKFVCYGSCGDLGLAARPGEDAELITRALSEN